MGRASLALRLYWSAKLGRLARTCGNEEARHVTLKRVATAPMAAGAAELFVPQL